MNSSSRSKGERRFYFTRPKQQVNIDHDQQRVSNILQFVGADANGIDAIEVYTLLQDTPLLVRPNGGWWCNPNFVPEDNKAFDQIVNEKSDDYLSPPPQAPGVGLAGALWVFSDDDGHSRKSSQASFTNASMTISRLSMARSWRKKHHGDVTSMIGKKVTGHDDHAHHLIWRDIHTLNLDPDQPTFLRLEVLEKAGFAKIAGVKFDMCGQKGIVVYFTKGNTNVSKLSSTENETYLRNAATMIGSSVALTKSRKALVHKTTSVDISKPVIQKSNESTINESKFLHNIIQYSRKLLGGNLQPPPPMKFSESFLSFFGAFVALLSVAGLSEAIKNVSAGKYSIIMGPFGALMTLQYSLVMAPASQPRNIIFGQTVAICISMCLSYVPEPVLPVWIRSSLATATTIGMISKMGIIHPPAGATALLVASSEFDWMVLPLMLVGNMVAIVIATVVNNLSENRQYPTYYYVGEKCLKRIVQSKLNPEAPSTSHSLDLEKSTSSKESKSSGMDCENSPNSDLEAS